MQDLIDSRVLNIIKQKISYTCDTETQCVEVFVLSEVSGN